MEFHVSRDARMKYQLEESLFSLSGNVVFPNFRAVRHLAQKMNQKRNVVEFPERTVRAGEINAMGLIDEILHYVFQLYREEKKSEVLTEALDWLEKKFGKDRVDETLYMFIDLFPPFPVYQGKQTVQEYLRNKSAGISNREIALEEMILLWLANLNPAFSPFQELFDHSQLERQSVYHKIMQSLPEFFDKQPVFGPDDENILNMLSSPATAVPHSLSGQLDYIRQKWGLLLGKYYYRLLSSLDFLKEEEKARFIGPGPTQVHQFGEWEPDFEKFSPDKDWMPRLILIAKSTYVWLDQLSKKYKRSITRLDQIPDEELDTLAKRGFTGLWLIGLWERSRASQKIKQLCGNPEAVASAYSLLDYEVAQELGGEEAFQNLKHRAWQRGIRLCGDMVPNHMGIDSRWVIEHPEWFISLDYSPFPSYTFNGPNLSWDDRVGIYIEDHYYDRTDAAVVFKRVDFQTGETKYIYHGNDGTSMPWNDTAQLNYLKPEVREAVIQTILKVARKFSVIRFDAAMTLTKKHYQRLWFPEPGTGGDIPSRAEHGMTREEFNAHMPKEFWREVVDRVAQEAPDTLLLAEAFWLMEGYFVRTLGMHRVYNSAFMNMLKNEENAKFRESIKNVLEFNPQILKRFVNFMNNPDEETAVAQFGKDDKYFGVCTMMVTLPGLPMFGHGQIEGFTEKYGMEYKKAYWEEVPDEHLIRRHEREIFPLMHRRYLFAEVENFLFFDFYQDDGSVNENVFAYSNRFGDECALVVYNNKFAEARGWIKMSVPYSAPSTIGNERVVKQKTLGEGFGLINDENHWVIFRDHLTGLQFIRNCKEIYEKGLYIELQAFKYQVFLDFREVIDNEWHHYAHLAEFLEGRGVPDIDQALRETFLQPVHQPFEELVNAHIFQELKAARIETADQVINQDLINHCHKAYRALLIELKKFTRSSTHIDDLANRFNKELTTTLQLTVLEEKLKCQKVPDLKEVWNTINSYFSDAESNSYLFLGWLVVHRLGAIVDLENFIEYSDNGMDEWMLGKIFQLTFQDLGMDEDQAYQNLLLLKILVKNQLWWQTEDEQKDVAYHLIYKILEDSNGQGWLQVNRFQDILWYNHGALQKLLECLLILAVLDAVVTSASDQEACSQIWNRYRIVQKIQEQSRKSDFQVAKLLEGLKSGAK